MPLAVAVVIALVPTIIHSYADVRIDDGRSVSAIPMTLAGFPGRVSARDGEWGRRRFDSHDWTERKYVNGQSEVTLTVLRSYDLKKLYHHPENDIAYGVPLRGRGTWTPPSHPDRPLHVMRSNTGQAMAVYALLHNGRFITDPIWFQIRSSLALLVSGRRPMTLFFALDDDERATSVGDADATKVVLDAIDRFLAPAPAR